MTGGDVLVAVLIALAGALGFFLVVLVGGSLLFPQSWERQTADQPPAASQPTRVTLPSSAPASAPTHTPEPDEDPSDDPNPEQTTEPVEQTADPAAEPSQAPAPAQTNAPTPAPSRAPAQNPGPAVSINPTVPPATPTQAPSGSQGSGSSGGQGGSGNFYAHDNPDQQETNAAYVLNTSTMKFHYPTCNDVRRIAPGNYAESNQTRDQIMRNGYSPCGHCNP